MKLSIIIPVYNVEEYLEECLNSIINPIKNRSDIELIIIDDGSTDSSSLIYDKYNYNWIKKIKISNSGVSTARNLGIKEAMGEWIMFVDSDDVLDFEWFNKISNYLDSKNEIVCFFDKVDESLNENKKELLDAMFGLNNKCAYLSSPCSRIIKRKVLIENKIFFKKGIINGEDLLLNLEIFLKSASYKIANISFYKYRVSCISATRSFNDKIFESDKMFHKELKNILLSNNVEKLETYTNSCVRSAIKLLLYRLSLVKKINSVKKYFKNLYDEPYNSYRHSNKLDIVSFASYFPILTIMLYKLKRLLKIKKEKFDEFVII